MDKSNPNVFSRRQNATTSGDTFTLGFAASFLRLANRGASDVFVRFDGTTASSGDMCIESSGKIESSDVPPFSSISLRADTLASLVYLSAMSA